MCIGHLTDDEQTARWYEERMMDSQWIVGALSASDLLARTRELARARFSEGAAYNRIAVARAGRQWPAVIDALHSGKVHLAGLRLLAPHLSNR